MDRTTDVKVKATASAAEIITHYEYDENGNLAEITDPNGGVTGFQYDDADRLEQRVLPNGVVTTYGYDSRDRVLSVVHKNASNAVLASVTYVRSPSGEPTRITREDGTYTLVEYDSALRISKESEFDANEVLVAETQYGYDLDGNRTSKTTLTGTQTYSYAAGFKLTGSSGVEGSEVYTHDAGGRLTGIERGGVSRIMEYDSMDHVTRIIDGGIEVERYTFDGSGRRVSANDGTGTRNLLVAPNLGGGYESPQAVTDAAGNMIAAFVYAGEHPIAKITPSGVEYLLADSMGSIIGKTDAAGSSTATIRYDAFGNVMNAVGSAAAIDPLVGSEHRFHGMQLDQSGVYFVRARSYDAKTGRFVSRDPVAGITAFPETMVSYTFANSNPFIFDDPSGRITLMELSVTSVIVGVVSGLAIGAFRGALHQFKRANGTESEGQAKQSREDYIARLDECIRANRLVDYEHAFTKFGSMFVDSFESDIVPEKLDNALESIGEVDALLPGIVGGILWTGSRALNSTQKILPLTGANADTASKAAVYAYMLRHMIVNQTTNPGILRFAHQAVGWAQMSATGASKALTPLFTAWGGHEGGVVLGCALGATQ